MLWAHIFDFVITHYQCVTPHYQICDPASPVLWPLITPMNIRILGGAGSSKYVRKEFNRRHWNEYLHSFCWVWTILLSPRRVLQSSSNPERTPWKPDNQVVFMSLLCISRNRNLMEFLLSWRGVNRNISYEFFYLLFSKFIHYNGFMSVHDTLEFWGSLSGEIFIPKMKFIYRATNVMTSLFRFRHNNCGDSFCNVLYRSTGQKPVFRFRLEFAENFDERDLHNPSESFVLFNLAYCYSNQLHFITLHHERSRRGQGITFEFKQINPW